MFPFKIKSKPPKAGMVIGIKKPQLSNSNGVLKANRSTLTHSNILPLEWAVEVKFILR